MAFWLKLWSYRGVVVLRRWPTERVIFVQVSPPPRFLADDKGALRRAPRPRAPRRAADLLGSRAVVEEPRVLGPPVAMSRSRSGFRQSKRAGAETARGNFVGMDLLKSADFPLMSVILV